MEDNELIPSDLCQNEVKQEIPPYSESICGVKEGIMYCLYCSYSDNDVSRLKFHMFREHPTRAAVVAHDIELFCIKETCAFSTTLYNIYEEHLMNCCLLHEDLSMVEKQRLNSTFKFILDFHDKHSLSAVSGFLDYVSSFKTTLICKDDEGQIGKDVDCNNLSSILSDPVSVLDGLKSGSNTGMNLETSLSSFPPPDLVHNRQTTDFNSSNNKVSICEKTSLGVGENGLFSSSVSEQERTSCGEEFIIRTGPYTTFTLPSARKVDMNHSDDDHSSVSESTDDTLSSLEETAGESINMNSEAFQTEDVDIPNQQSRQFTRTTTWAQSDGHTPYNDERMKTDVSNDCERSHIGFENLAILNKGIHASLKVPPTEQDQHGTNVFFQNNSLSLHSRTHTREILFQCNECDKVFGRNSSLINHMRTHKGERQFKCSDCGKIFGRKSHMVRHMKIHTGEKPFECDDCHKIYGHKSDLERHLRTHTGEKPFVCTVCGKAFADKRHFNSHMSIHTEGKQFKCNECDKSFGHKRNLLKHIKIHTGERPFKCNECGQNFRDKSNIVNHMRTHTGEKPFECNECHKIFGEKCTMIRHMRIHTGEKPFICNECGKAFVDNRNLINHMGTHTGEEPFKCNECNKSFGHRRNFLKHKKTHTGEKPFKCNECGKNFTDKSNLINHMRTHTGEKPFKCEKCGKSFSQNSNLIRHLKRHTGEKPYKCNECDKAFGEKSHLTRHKRLHIRINTFK